MTISPRYKYFLLVLFALIFFSSGCTFVTSREVKEVIDPQLQAALSKLCLNNFLGLLQQKQYQQAVPYYGGDFNETAYLELNLDQEKSAIFAEYCQKSKLCLNYNIVNIEQVNDKDTRFTVQFFGKDGKIYKSGGCPCKGGGKENFEFIVRKAGEQYFVMEMAY